MKKLLTILVSLTLITAAGCGSDDQNNGICKGLTDTECTALKKDLKFKETVNTKIATQPSVDNLKKDAVSNYSEVAYAAYSDTVAAAEALQKKVDAFHDYVTGTPTPSVTDIETKLNDLKEEWKKARPTYLQTEVYRFYDGPINSSRPDANDGDLELEPLINAWPMNEAYLDYVCESDDNAEPPKENTKAAAYNCNPVTSAGIHPIDTAAYQKSLIGDTSFDITEANLREKNEGGHTDGNGAEEKISTGWHAIEFLLWGQDHNFDGPGERPATDYLIGTGGEGNAKRRVKMLKVLTDMMVKDLTWIRDQWKPSTAGNYREGFEKDYKESFHKILNALKSLTINETGGERVSAAIRDQTQEQEHSCFSDNTDKDMIYDIQGLLNVWNGTYTRWDVAAGKMGTTVVGDASKGIVKVAEAYEAAEAQYDQQHPNDKIFGAFATSKPSQQISAGLQASLTAAKNLLSSDEMGKSFDKVLLKSYIDASGQTQENPNFQRLQALYDALQSNNDPYTNLFSETNLDLPVEEE